MNTAWQSRSKKGARQTKAKWVVVVGAVRRPSGARASGIRDAEVSIFEFDGASWNFAFQDTRRHVKWINMSGSRFHDPKVEVNGSRAVTSHILGAVLYLRQNNAWTIADITHTYSFIGGISEESLKQPKGKGYLVYHQDDAINTYYNARVKFIDNQLRVYHHDYESNLCPGSLIYGCKATSPIHVFNFDNEPLETAGTKAELIRLNVWSELATPPSPVPTTQSRGYIATYSCALEEDAPSGLTIDFNYKGPGTDLSAWMLTYAGDVTTGFIGTGNSYAIKPASNIQSFVRGNKIEFEFLAQDASFFDNDFNVRCISL